jgi:hypothetical protein
MGGLPTDDGPRPRTARVVPLAFIVFDDSCYVNGVNLVIDGGRIASSDQHSPRRRCHFSPPIGARKTLQRIAAARSMTSMEGVPMTDDLAHFVPLTVPANDLTDELAVAWPDGDQSIAPARSRSLVG